MREGLRTLADLVERIEVDGVVVDDVSLSRDDGDELAVDVSMRFPPHETEVPIGETDGGRQEQFYRGATTGPTPASPADEPSTPISPDFGGLAVRVGGATFRKIDDVSATAGKEAPKQEDGAGSSSTDELFACRLTGCDETFETEHGMKIHATKAHQAADGSAPSPHRDPERLREVYEACDTFEEMTDALDVDVTAQTVRRSMMSLGVHNTDGDEHAGRPNGSAERTGQPNGSDEGRPKGSSEDKPKGSSEGPPEGSNEPLGEDREDSGNDADEGDAAAAGSGESTPEDSGGERAVDADAIPSEVEAALPSSVDAVALVAAIEEANTLYEVQRRLEMDREAVQNLLAELDLLDLVHGRVATKGQREEQKTEIERRIVEQAGSGNGAHVGAE